MTRLFLVFFCLLALISGGRAAGVTDAVDWSSFLARHDLVWDLMPNDINNAPIIGNGGVSASIHKFEAAPLTWQVYRIDVTDHRMPTDRPLHPLFDTCRLAIGYFTVQPVGKVESVTMRVHLWDAVCTGELKTDKGTIAWRSFVAHDQDLIVADFTTTGDEKGFTWKWTPFPSSSPRYLGKIRSRLHMTPEQLKQAADPIVDSYQLNPDPQVEENGDLLVSRHALLAGGGFAVACRTEHLSDNERIERISIQPVSDHAADDAVKVVNGTDSADALFAANTAWWHAYYQAAFLSIPDTKLEDHYWIQAYKLASLTRPGGPPIDVYGYGIPDQYAGWPNIWWNMNVEEAYYGCFEGNHPELGESLTSSLEKYAGNLAQNLAPVHWQDDSAWIGRASDQQLRIPASLLPDGTIDTKSMELSDLSWAMELYHRQCRYTGDDERLKTKFLPLLARCVNFYRHLLVKGPDGKLHLPEATSPEIGTDTDLNYDIGALRWDLATLIGENQRLGLNPPEMAGWQDLQNNLVGFQVGKNGLKIGAKKELIFSHRHYSHLLGFYPLYVLDWDNPGDRDLIKQSVDYWYGLFTDPLKKHERFFGYSQTGAASMFASMGRGDDALAALDGYLTYNCTPNAFYQEGTIEVPFSVSQSTQEMLLQSRKGIIRAFPAMPSTWKDAVFENLRTEGAFLVSGRWRDGKADWVRVKSLAGEPCKLRVHFDGPVATLAGATLKAGNDDTYELALKKGEEVTLYLSGATPEWTVAPLPGTPEQFNSFGYTQAIVAERAKMIVKLDPQFKKGMTLPADTPFNVSGEAGPGTTVIVQCNNDGRKMTVDASGKWTATFNAIPAHTKMVSIDATNEYGDVSVKNILIGDASTPAP